MREAPSLEEFERKAREVYESIPATFREGISGLVVHGKRVTHPHLDDYETLGECEPDYFTGEGSDRTSTVHLYYGSFSSLARREDDFDWDDELRETVEHEIRHHLEDRAGAPDLRRIDWAEEQNERRRGGQTYDPLFYRAGEVREPDEFWVQEDCFLEVRLSRRMLKRLAGKLHPVTFGEETFEVLVPAQGGDVRYVDVEGGWMDDDGNGGDLQVVFVTTGRWLRK
ncbi:MAG TPA: metallopeptidase family protein [Planctomycetota bacterium]|nr:metallopeptidase family protein [Planctomycetota bacterium]